MMQGSLEHERAMLAEAVGGRTLVDVLARNAHTHPDAPAIAWRQAGDWHRYDWAEYRRRVLAVAAGFLEVGVEPGDRVAIMAGNRPEHVLADLGAVHAGATPVTVYSTLAPDQLAYVAGHAGIRLAVVEDEATARRWMDVRDRIPTLERIVVLDEDGGTGSATPWSRLMEAGDSALAAGSHDIEAVAARVAPDDIATLIYTSGTTGEPKGVVITQANVMWTLATMAHAIDLPDRPQLVSYLPLAHIAERMATHYLGMWVIGEVTYCANVAAVMGVVKEIRPHLFVGVPRIWEQVHRRIRSKLESEENPRRAALIQRAVAAGEQAVDGTVSLVRRAEHSVLDRAVLRAVRSELGLDRAVLAVTTAGPIDPEIIRSFRALGIPLHELFGMTECSGPATANLPGFDRIGSVGRALAGVEVATADDGELLIRGGNVAAGYERAPDETEAAFDETGWLRTGDLAEIDQDGYVTIVGRKKDLIVNAAGKNISPVGIELLLKRHPIVAEACVVGDRKPHLAALVVPDPEWIADSGLSLDPHDGDLRRAIQRVIDDVNAQVSAVERIKRFVVVTDEWTNESGVLTPSLKLRRNVVLERYASVIAEL